MKNIIIAIILSLSFVSCASNKPRAKDIPTKDKVESHYQWGFKNSPVGIMGKGISDSVKNTIKLYLDSKEGSAE